jgi:hypothetical protein
MGKFLDTILRFADRRLVTGSGYELLSQERNTLRCVAARWATPPSARSECAPSGIVFSKDRAFQLQGLLRSFALHCTDPDTKLHIVYRASDAAHEAAYQQVFAQGSRDRFIARRESALRDDLLAVLSAIDSDAAYFLVDDIIFVAPFSLRRLASFDLRTHVPSLRIAAGQDYCYTRARPQKIPSLTVTNEDLIAWRWTEGEHDWGFPLSLDGHLFDRRELECLLHGSQFVAPNSLETSLQIYQPLFLPRKGIAYRQPRLINTPWNRVQTEVDNRHGNFSVAELLVLWQQGRELDIESYAGATAPSTHDELPLRHRARLP